MRMSFNEKVVYQIYPKSYRDSNGDGIGDLKGIKEKLPYLHELGVDMIWLNPIYPSPQKDNGYDISDYVAIDPLFGTMEEFEELVTQAKSYNIEIMLDMVLNHVSIEHEWFQKALAGDRFYQDFFILRDEPTDWVSKFGGNAWAPFGDTGKYYLHLYDQTQADLNWRNEAVQAELFKVVRFWMSKGVKGFRFDVINVIGKDEELKNNAENQGKAEYTDKPITHTYLQRLNRETFGQDPEIITVGEMSSTTIENCILYTEPSRNELSMVFNFHHLKVDYENGNKWSTPPFDFEALKSLFHTWGEAMSKGNGWNALFLNNHDQPRVVSRFGNDSPQYRERSAKMLATCLHMMQGTPYIYQGEELGMTNYPFASMDEFRDIESINAYKEWCESGRVSHEEFWPCLKLISRDNARTPVQWDDTENAGFTTGTPWITVNPNYKEINAAVELKNPSSVFHYYQKLIALRKQYPIIVYGKYELLLPEDENLFVYSRELDNEKLLAVCNFSEQKQNFTVPEGFRGAKCLISNVERSYDEKDIVLEPYEAFVLK